MDRIDVGNIHSEARAYLGAKEGEKLCPALASFLSSAVDRLDRQRGPSPSGTEWNGHAVRLKDLGMLIEAWLVANPEPPLWPKDYDHEKAMAPFLTLRTGDPRPKWMQRRWV